MVKAERILFLVSLLALGMNLFLVPFGGIATFLLLGAFAIFYFYFGYRLFNELENSPNGGRGNKNQLYGIKKFVILGTSYVLSGSLVGIIFKFQSFPNPNFLIGAGVIGGIIILVIGNLKYKPDYPKSYSILSKRILPVCIICLVLLVLPRHSILEFKYRNYPKLIEAIKIAESDPNNQDNWKRVDEERRNMHAEENR